MGVLWVRNLGGAGLGMVGLGGVAWALRRWTIGDIDPLGAVIGLLSGLAGLAALVVAVRTWRLQQADTEVLAGQLAVAVLAREQQARRQLLGEASRTIDVRFSFQRAPTHNAGQARGGGRLSEVAAYYRRLRPRRIVITGAAGAGKTVLAVELIMLLLKDWTPGDPVPVRLPASSWNACVDQAGKPAAADRMMRRWLATHLVEVYSLSPRSAEALVDAGGILPVVDGLDELDATDEPGYASRAGHALRAFNRYQRYQDKAPLIVTCRSGHYQALTVERSWVEDAARVEIQPVDAVQARAFITASTVDADRWRPVLERIENDRNGLLAGALATPWRLTLATAVYEQRDCDGAFVRDPRELAGPTLDTPDKIRDHLLGLFLTVRLESGATQSYDPVRAYRWLAVLACYLERNASGRSIAGRPLSGADIMLHELWPLAGMYRPRVLASMIIAASWLAGFCLLLPEGKLSGFSVLWRIHAGGLAFFGLLYVCFSWVVWPSPLRLKLDGLRTSSGRRRLAGRLVDGLMLGFVAWAFDWLSFYLATGAPVALAIRLAYGHTDDIPVWLVFGLAAGFLFGLAEKAGVQASDPRSVVRDDLAAGLGTGLAAGLVASLVFQVLALPVGLVGGICRMHYVPLLLCTRRWSRNPLPWRLGRFLNACYRVGLVRIAGSGYQFRHRELQDYLARNPVP